MKAPTLVLGNCGFIFLVLFSTLSCTTPQSPGKFQNQSENSDSRKIPNTNRSDTVRINLPSYPLNNAKDLDVLIKEIGDAKVVLLGEASHGTSEFYTWRTAISKRLVIEKGFNFIAVEGEWADSYKVNEFIKGDKKDSVAVIEVLKNYNRWPRWMWSNYEVASLVTWLNTYNQNKADKSKIGFYGLDVFCLWESLTKLMPLVKNAPALVQDAVKNIHSCFQPYINNIAGYGSSAERTGKGCGREADKLWQQILGFTGAKVPANENDFLVQQYALQVMNGERYYSTAVTNYAESWNIRDRHMAVTLKRLLELHGNNSKAIVWEHNTHVGDARYTTMARNGQTNIGEIVRKDYGEKNVYIVGFGTYSGTVIAAERWGGTVEKMQVPPAVEGSWDHIMHKAGVYDKIILSREIANNRTYNRWINQRAIGVVYNPQLEKTRNYVSSLIPKRYDAFIYFDKSNALRPLEPVGGKDAAMVSVDVDGSDLY
jgi:erythromycin esterase-like protein